MLTSRAEIARERRRQMQVRKAFEAGLFAAPGGSDLSRFSSGVRGLPGVVDGPAARAGPDHP